MGLLLEIDYTLAIVSVGSGLLGLISGILGVFAVLRKQSLLGDAVAHAALPGIAITFLLTQTRQTELLLLGATVSGAIATLIIISIDKYSRIKYDSALALILSVFFGFGLVLMTFIQKIPNANQAGLDRFIFGQASTILMRDIRLMIWVAVVLLSLTFIFWKEFKMFSFDPQFTAVSGFSTKAINSLLSIMIVITIMVGIQTAGVILMSSLIIAPGSAARQWSNKLSIVTLLAGIFGAVSGFIGTFISSTTTRIPTGPMIVIILSIFTLFSLIFAPNRGLLWSHIRMIKNKESVSYDKILISLYQLAMNHENIHHHHDILMITPLKNINGKPSKALILALANLKEKGLIKESPENKFGITELGIKYVNENFMKGELYEPSK